MYEFVVTTNRNREIDKVLIMDGQTETVKFNIEPWEGDNGTVTSVTWSVVSGNATISNEALASSVASARVSGSSAGKSLVKLTLTTTGNVGIVYLEVYVRDPQVVVGDGMDYV
jgi:hypothetical protein